MRNSIKENPAGFTLIELMIVVAIIGILAAIAVPQFAAYRQRGHNAAARSALKNLATVQEAYYAEKLKYTPNEADWRAYAWTRGTDAPNIPIFNVGANTTAWSARTRHLKGDGTVYTYDSHRGGFQ